MGTMVPGERSTTGSRGTAAGRRSSNLPRHSYALAVYRSLRSGFVAAPSEGCGGREEAGSVSFPACAACRRRDLISAHAMIPMITAVASNTKILSVSIRSLPFPCEVPRSLPALPVDGDWSARDGGQGYDEGSRDGGARGAAVGAPRRKGLEGSMSTTRAQGPGEFAVQTAVDSAANERCW